MTSSKRSGWDPLVIISQIVALQACHYLLLAILTPPLLSTFADPVALSLEGGASNVAMIMDWREMVGRATIDQDQVADYLRLPPSLGRHKQPWGDDAAVSVNAQAVNEPAKNEDKSIAGGQKELAHQLQETAVRQATLEDQSKQYGYIAADARRGWTLGACWIAASMIDILYFYYVIRRPTHILDFSLTLVLNHIILTTYYASSFPTSLYFWLIIAISAAIQIVWSEQLCVKREMKEGFTLGQGWKTDERNEDLPLHHTGNGARRQRRNSAPSAVTYERIPMAEVG